MVDGNRLVGHDVESAEGSPPVPVYDLAEMYAETAKQVSTDQIRSPVTTTSSFPDEDETWDGIIEIAYDVEYADDVDEDKLSFDVPPDERPDPTLFETMHAVHIPETQSSSLAAVLSAVRGRDWSEDLISMSGAVFQDNDLSHSRQRELLALAGGARLDRSGLKYGARPRYSFEQYNLPNPRSADTGPTATTRGIIGPGGDEAGDDPINALSRLYQPPRADWPETDIVRGEEQPDHLSLYLPDQVRITGDEAIFIVFDRDDDVYFPGVTKEARRFENLARAEMAREQYWREGETDLGIDVTDCGWGEAPFESGE